MQLHLIQHGLLDQHSHFCNETLAWRAAVLARGIGWHCHAHRAIAPGLAALLDAGPAFRIVPDAVIEADASLRKPADFIDSAEAFAEDLEQALGGGIGADDLVLVPYASERELFGLALWLRARAGRPVPRLAAIIHRPDYDWEFSPDRTRLNGDVAYWHYAGRRLAAACGGRLPFIGANDPRLAALAQHLLGMPVQALPMVSFAGPDLPGALLSASRRFHLGLLGQPRSERHFPGLAARLAGIARRWPQLRFQVQLDSANGSAEAWGAAFAAAGVAPCLHMLLGNPDTASFHAALAQCRMLILPYNPERYRLRSSGIMSEAIGFGIPAIVPRDTWMADRIAEGAAAGFAYATLDEALLERALTLPPPAWREVQERAAALAAPWRARNSAPAVLAMILQGLSAGQ